MDKKTFEISIAFEEEEKEKAERLMNLFLEMAEMLYGDNCSASINEVEDCDGKETPEPMPNQS